MSPTTSPDASYAFPVSILDTDLYKQAVLQHFSKSIVSYKFTNRSAATMNFSRECLALFEKNIAELANLSLTGEERAWLEEKCPYFTPSYLDFLAGLRLKPSEQVKIRYIPLEGREDIGNIEIDVHGLWVETILYEVPVMAALSDAYFRTVDTDWSYDGQEELAYRKGLQFFRDGILLSEFGTRRRRSLKTQHLVVQGLVRAHNEIVGKEEGVKGRLSGTSNVHLARLFNLTPIGTIAHEWTMGMGALHNYDNPNILALTLWEKTYPPHPSNALHIALTDTFTSDAFFSEMRTNEQGKELMKRWRGLRQDSGDPKKFIKSARKCYESEEVGLTEDWRQKVLVFSDGLDAETVKVLKGACEDEGGFVASFGVGTFMTNDFKSSSTGNKSKALNIVIKLNEIDGRPCIKLSDDLSKTTGDKSTVEMVKQKLGL